MAVFFFTYKGGELSCKEELNLPYFIEIETVTIYRSSFTCHFHQQKHSLMSIQNKSKVKLCSYLSQEHQSIGTFFRMFICGSFAVMQSESVQLTPLRKDQKMQWLKN